MIAALLLSASDANAGWFGPSDYRECVLSEMKGTAIAMLSTVEGLCDKRFPCPKPTPSDFAECNVSHTAASEGMLFTPRDFCIDSVRVAACSRR